MSAPIFCSASVKPKRFSYTVSWIVETPSACVSATTSGCCQSVMKPGCTSVSITTGLSAPPGCQKRMPSSCTSNSPPTFRNTFRKVIMCSCFAPLTNTSPWVASAAEAQEAASLRSKIARWV